MDWQKLGLALMILVFFLGIGTVFAYTGTGDSDSGSGGGPSDGNTNPPEGNEGGGENNDGGSNSGGGGDGGTDYTGVPGSCYDTDDNDLFNNADRSDEFSCVLPLGSDHIEGSIWDTDLTTTMSGEAPPRDETVSVFFAGSVEQGNDNEQNTQSDSDSIIEHYIVDIQSESDGYYGYGKHDSVDSYSGFPEGTVFQNGRAIDPPNDITEQCGDGFENEGLSKTGKNSQSTSGIDCRPDYGRIRQTYDADGDPGSESSYQRDGLTCRSDNEDSGGGGANPTCTDAESGECSGGSSSSCTSDTCDPGDDATCKNHPNKGTWNDAWSSDESHNYWETSGDVLIHENCNVVGSWSERGTEGSDDSCTDYSTEQVCSPLPDGSQACTSYCESSDGGSCSGGDSESISGDYRDWEDTRTNCNNFNLVDGGGESSGDDSGADKADNDPAGTFTEFTAYNGNDRVWCGYEYTLTVDADGPKGYGDGFVVIHEGSIVATESPDGSDTVGTVHHGRDGSIDSTSNYLNRVSTSCPGDKTTCLKYVDFMTVGGSGTQGSPEWTTVDDAVKINDGETETYTADESYSVCKKINDIAETQASGPGHEIIECDYERGSKGSEDISPLPEVAGDEPNEQLMMMEGPEVDNSVTKEYLAFEQRVVDWDEDTGVFGESLDSNACITKGKAVSEGTVAPIQTYNVVDESFEMGDPSPDWEVCLDLDDGTGDDKPWDNQDNSLSSQDFGGEWYDLDDERINGYLSGNNLISGGDPDDINDIAYYWRTNPNPQHSTYNPTGGQSGVALEDDCDPALNGCDTTGNSVSGNGLFFGNFTDFSRDEDYHPQSENSTPPYGMNPRLDGHLKKLKEDSDQLEPGMETEYSMDFNDQDNYWLDSRGGQNYADQFGYVDDRSDAISNRGNSRNPNTGEDYRPGQTYARTSSAIRGSIRSDSVMKTQKVFGNSIVVESTSSGQFKAGEGYWLDPDELEANNTDFKSNWWDLVRFNIDITGPDSGLGWDDGSNPEIASYDTKQGSSVIRGGIHWEDEGSGGSDYQEPPMCGDDQFEFLVEEVGESVNPGKSDGRYACVTSKDKCVTFADDPPVADIEEYRQAGEPDEEFGRLKNDKEICLKDYPDQQSKWWDQDYGDVTGDGVQDTCNVNDLYGSEAIRWIDADYVSNHPHAVTGGIDDDWNQYIQQQHESGRHEEYVSEPGEDSWSFGSESPVPSGSRAVGNDSIATLGFCGGDDEGEYLVTQQCNTNLCDTNRSIVGVSKNPDGCVIDEETMSYNTDVDERKVFDAGSEITVDLGGESRQMTCFNNYWFDDYPVIFNQQNVEVPFGESTTVSFHVINVQEERTTFEVEMIDPLTDNPSAYQYSTFVEESGDSFETTVAPRSTETYYINVDGSNKAIGDSSQDSEDDLTVRASAVNSEMRGQDFTTVEVVENNATNTSVGRTEPQSVPGVGTLHLIVLALISSAVFFLQS